ncbi:Flavin-dependent monooxygenase, oxygenase subunit HsaA [Delftia tsuruhatensis]|uniref:acyl-CoA dehydrogenase family protein n=1 Tax=Delftia tsuruhatensis TaxID=180282 RepID=UPI001E7951F3|nr:acyl-CoA dehydrogenase family protein [Delftia tsuruhatensis]CAB5688298.1 Flavin-dependent monooxygenase, oxygenase subunit HsaA [Delftia tsuruhatensis]CAC9690887.1 Flavin-dependent monooxygenase, oxygenase subunit HsaA [Delftia tsuruhatensis]
MTTQTPSQILPPVPEDAPTLHALQARFRPVFEHIARGAAERERTRTLAHDAIARLRDSGFTALRVPRHFGGLGATVEQLFALLVELAEADSNVAQILRPHFGFLDRVLIDRDAAAQARWLPLAAQGAVFGNATTETGAGAVGALQTTLVPDTGPETGWWRLDGRKFYSTGALYADWVTVVARAVVPGREDETVHAIVPTRQPGVQRLDDWRGFGQRLTGSGTTVLDRVRVPEADVMRFPRARPTPLVAYFQLFHLATLAGIARALRRDAVDYVRARRRVFSHGSAALPKDDPLVQQIVGQLGATAYLAEVVAADVAAALGRIARERAQGHEIPLEELDALELRTAQAQVAVAEPVLQAAARLFEVGGSSALAEDLALDRHWRNARTLASHNPVLYKARSVGDILLNDARPVYYWNVGVAG